MIFRTPSGVLTTRAQAAEVRLDLETQFEADSHAELELSFAGVDALTISFADEFLGRFLTELQATARDPGPILVTGLTEDTWQEVDVVLERRKLGAAFTLNGRLDLLGGDRYLKATFRHAVEMGACTPGKLAAGLGITVPNANNRLKKLVEMGALQRTRSPVAGGGREFTYEVPEGFQAASAS